MECRRCPRPRHLLYRDPRTGSSSAAFLLCCSAIRRAMLCCATVSASPPRTSKRPSVRRPSSVTQDRIYSFFPSPRNAGCRRVAPRPGAPRSPLPLLPSTPLAPITYHTPSHTPHTSCIKNTAHGRRTTRVRIQPGSTRPGRSRDSRGFVDARAWREARGRRRRRYRCGGSWERIGRANSAKHRLVQAGRRVRVRAVRRLWVEGQNVPTALSMF